MSREYMMKSSHSYNTSLAQFLICAVNLIEKIDFSEDVTSDERKILNKLKIDYLKIQSRLTKEQNFKANNIIKKLNMRGLLNED